MKVVQKNQNLLKDKLSFISLLAGISLALCVLFVVACDEKKTGDPEPDPYLTVEPVKIEFMNVGGKRTVTVDTNIEGWIYALNANWMSAKRTSDGKGIELTARPNTNDAERKGTLTLIAGNYTSENKLVELSQGPTHLTVTPKEAIELGVDAEEVMVTVETNIEEWDFTLEENDWLTAVKTSSGVKLTALANPTTSSRSVDMSIYAEEFGLEYTLTVTQEGIKYLIVEPEETVGFEVSGGVSDVTVSTNVEEWDFTLEENDWVTAVKTTTGLRLTVSPNPTASPRSVNLSIHAEEFDLEQTLTVTQEAGKYLIVAPEETVEFAASGGVSDVTVSTNVEEWDFTLDVNDWVTAVKTATGLRLTAAENTNTTSRSVSLRIQAEDLEEILTVRQAAKLDRLLFSRWNPPGIPYLSAGGWEIERLWDNNTASGHFGNSTPGFIFNAPAASLPNSFTFEIGQLAKIRSMKLYSRMELTSQIYANNHPKRITIWGSPTSDVTADFSTWIYLGEFNALKPSGTTLTGGSTPEEDLEYLRGGMDFIATDNTDVPIRYLRFHVCETWLPGGSNVALMEIEIFGITKE